MEGAGGYISNPTGLFALAEGLKIPRILIPCDSIITENGTIIKGPTNVTPIGGICNLAHNTGGLVNAINDLKKVRLSWWLFNKKVLYYKCSSRYTNLILYHGYYRDYLIVCLDLTKRV